MDDDAFKNLVCRLRAGDASAADELVADHEVEIRRYVRFRLRNSRMRRLVESVDVSQSVFARFFVDLHREAVCPDSPAQLRALLITMAKNKLIDHARYNNATKRDLARVEVDGDMAIDAATVVGPSPGSVMADREMLDAVRRGLTAEELELIDARLDGRSWNELAAQFGSTPEALRKRVTRLIASAANQLGVRA